MPVHPHSLANLKPGFKVKDLAARKAHSVKMNAARRDAQRQRLEAKAAQLHPVQAFRLGYRRGQNTAYMRWKVYADRVIQQAFRELQRARKQPAEVTR